MVRLKDIAERAGVSVQVVSAIVNRSHTTSGASQKTRERVLKVVRELGYTPHATATSLARGVSLTVGLICPNLTDPHMHRAIAAAEACCAEHNHSLMLSSPRESLDWVLMLRRRQVDLLLAVSMGTLDLAKLTIPAALRPRVVVIGPADDLAEATPKRQWGAQFSWHDAEGGALAAAHLLDRGCRRPAVLAGNNPAAPKVRGFLDHLGSQKRAAQVMTCPDEADKGVAAEGMTRRLLADQPDTDGLFLRTDQFIPGVLAALLPALPRLPGPLHLVGYGGFDPCLASIRTPIDDCVRQALTLYFTGGIAALKDARFAPRLAVPAPAEK